MNTTVTGWNTRDNGRRISESTNTQLTYRQLRSQGWSDMDIVKHADNSYATPRPDADELILYAVNTAELYPRHLEITAFLTRKKAAGKDKPYHAFNLLKGWFFGAAWMYAAEMHAPVAWTEDIIKAAREYAEQINDEVVDGEYDWQVA